ncbi:hypothetical protein GJQ54_09165 [Oceanospirillaceae bacterium ASx5O]|nr:hypothetical protein GJQ54_09165 [Oceanospirillaceae bacterium ASx5O]
MVVVEQWPPAGKVVSITLDGFLCDWYDGEVCILTPALVVAFSLALHQKISFKQLLPLGVVSMLIMLVLHFLRSGSFALDDLGHFFSVYTLCVNLTLSR